jgi:signal transduction histidine kinase
VAGRGTWLGRLWPQRVRTRLTLIYALLFLAGGSALLALTYGLMAASLPTYPSPFARSGRAVAVTKAKYAALCTKPKGRSVVVKPGASPTPRHTPQPVPVNPKVSKFCEAVYVAGLRAGSADQRSRALDNLLLYSLAGLGLMTVASGGAGWVISGRVLRPVRSITETARRASEQHLGERIGLTGARDELRELADTFDDMLERLDRAFAAQRRFVADASHELRTPLTVMRTAIDVTLAKPGRTPEQLEAMAIRVRRSVERAERMIEALLTLAVSDRGELTGAETFDLATAAEDAVDAAAGDVERLGLHLSTDLDTAITTGDPSLLDRMIGNLIDNAVRHNEAGGMVNVSSGVQDGTAFVRIMNSGPVVPEADVPGLFEPFHRGGGRSAAKAGADGVGLGLAIARSIAAAHGAVVQAQPRPGGGLDVVVIMPAATST